jgi:hypothetical protein
VKGGGSFDRLYRRRRERESAEAGRCIDVGKPAKQWRTPVSPVTGH